jgi:hypothetical protein
MMTSTEIEPRRVAIVLARYDARAAAPPGIDPTAFADACLADTYETLADLVEVRSGVAGPPEVAELLWPGALHLSGELSVAGLADALADQADELVVVPADVPDLPGLVLAKLFKVLHRVDLATAPERAGAGCVALGLALPLASWLPAERLTLDHDPYPELLDLAPDRRRVARGPDWHRLRTPADVHRLDPGLEGWDETRALLSGRSLAPG